MSSFLPTVISQLLYPFLETSKQPSPSIKPAIISTSVLRGLERGGRRVAHAWNGLCPDYSRRSDVNARRHAEHQRHVLGAQKDGHH